MTSVPTIPGIAPRLITPKEAAALLNVTPRTILNWIERGAIPYIELPSGEKRKEYRIPLGALLRSLSGNYDLAGDLARLEEAATEAGLTEEQITAALTEQG